MLSSKETWGKSQAVAHHGSVGELSDATRTPCRRKSGRASRRRGRGSTRPCGNSSSKLELENMARTDGQRGATDTQLEIDGEKGKRTASSPGVRVHARRGRGCPRWPDFAGVQGGKRGYAGRCNRPWLDCFRGELQGDEAVLHASTVRHLVV
jgi:hypothetical protein